MARSATSGSVRLLLREGCDKPTRGLKRILDVDRGQLDDMWVGLVPMQQAQYPSLCDELLLGQFLRVGGVVDGGKLNHHRLTTGDKNRLKGGTSTADLIFPGSVVMEAQQRSHMPNVNPV